MCTTWLAGRVCRRAGSGFFPRLSRSWHSRCFVRFDAHALLDGRYMADNTASLLYPRDHKVPLRVAAASRVFWVQLFLQERPSPLPIPPFAFSFSSLICFDVASQLQLSRTAITSSTPPDSSHRSPCFQQASMTPHASPVP